MMENYEWMILIMDLILLVHTCRMMYLSRKVRLESQAGSKWTMPVIYAVISLISVFRFTGMMKYIQSLLMLFLAVLSSFLKHGLAEDGIVRTGSFVPYTKAGTITLSYNHSCIFFRAGNRDAMMSFDYDQLPAVREYLRERSSVSHL